MKLVLSTNSNNPDFNADIDYFYIDLSAEAARTLLQRMELLRQLRAMDNEVYKLVYWGTPDCNNYWFAYASDDDVNADTFDEQVRPFVERVIEDDRIYVLPATFVIPENMSNAAGATELDQTEILWIGCQDQDMEVCFTCAARHVDGLEITSARLTDKFIKEIANASV